MKLRRSTAGRRVTARLLGALVALTFWWGAAGAEEERTPERQAYETIVKMFADGLYGVVDRNCAGFAEEYGSSSYLPDILLMQAQARLRLGRFDEAAGLLAEAADRAGRLGDEFAFWQAVALMEKGDVAAAAEAFASMVGGFPKSARRLEAIYNEAYARFRIGDTPQAVELLRKPDGVFRSLAAEKPEDEWVVRGWLLLGEILLFQQEGEGARAALGALEGKELDEALDWRRRFLLTQVEVLEGRPPAALGQATNLWTRMTNRVSAEVLADAVMLQAEIFERLEQYAQAQPWYERNLAPGVPPDQRRRALQRLIALNLRQGRVDETIQRLMTLATDNPQDPMLDLIRLALGELRLKKYYALKESVATAAPDEVQAMTNLLEQARVEFEAVLKDHPKSGFLGKAQLNRGWCFWEEGTNRLADGLRAFKAAADQLPSSVDQAVARFKLADCQWLARDMPSAISNYWFVATNYSGTVGFTNAMSGQALYQVVRAGISANDLGASADALERLLKTDPRGELADRSSLLMGQALNRQGKPEAARALYADFSRRFTNSTLLPAVELAVADTYVRQQAWPEALAAYSEWLAAYGSQETVSTTLLARASFDFARLSYRAEPSSNSVQLLTQFVTRFPRDTNAPVARYLSGEYAFDRGEYGNAELVFQDPELLNNPVARATRLAYRSRLMAGRAALARQSYRSAREHFDWIIENGPLYVADSPLPVSVVAEAYILRGDTFLLEPVNEGDTNALRQFGQAITAFSKVAERFPTNDLAPVAWGRIGDCRLQLAVLDPKQYADAADAYRRVTNSFANITIRSMAAVRLGTVLEKQAKPLPVGERALLLDQAMDCYLSVFYGSQLRPGEQPDAYWVKRAGLAAAELAEGRQDRLAAIGIYRRLAEELPPLRARMERRIGELEQLGTTPNEGR